MKVLFNAGSEYKDGHQINLDFSQFENGKNNLLYAYGIDAGYRMVRPDRSLFTSTVYFEGEEPNGFVNGQLPHERGNWELDYWTKILHTCPYTAAWENAVYDTDKFELTNTIHNEKLMFESEKIYDVCYIGSTGFDKGYSIHYQITDIIKKFPKYRFVSRDPLPHVTNKSVSHIDKLKINSQCKISVCTSLLHTTHPYLIAQQSSNIKKMPHWELNEAFKMIDYGFMPQIKGRVTEAGATKSLVLLLKDEWNVVEYFYKPNEHFIYFDSLDKLEDTIKDCLNNWSYCEKIIDNMYNYVKDNYVTEKFYKRHLENYDI
jgi:hypothetical protein